MAKINPPERARQAANMAVKARIEAVAAINKASAPTVVIKDYETALAESNAVMLDEQDKRLWINFLMYAESRDYLLALAHTGGDWRPRFETIISWLTGATSQDFYLAHRIQALANCKYGAVLNKYGADMCLGCGKEVSERPILGGRLSAFCASCASEYNRTPDLILFERSIALKMFISVQEYRWRVATEANRIFYSDFED